MITGVSEGFHDAAICTINDGEILYASHAERHSKIKNDKHLYPSMEIKGTSVFYEKPFIKNLRRIYAGQKWKQRQKYNHYISHHWSHAAAAYYTRPFTEEPVCVIIDAIGEWDTCSIWYNKKKVWSLKYPKSLGLFYSAITKACGFKPGEDEYITMGMAAYGDTRYQFNPYHNYHQGGLFEGSPEDLAASAQKIIEDEIIKIMKKARQYSSYLCYGGGVALNCVANSKICPMFDKIWIFPNPGDAGSSLGAAAAYYDKPLNWVDPYLGTEIKQKINPKEVAQYLIVKSLCGIANGKAEFGPRALGNRSLLADPRLDIKNTVNDIKQRQRFRPFAPAILEEYADKYFEGPMNEYMQYVAIAKHDYNAVTHIDGTARVQIVKPNCNSILRSILEEWYELTGCPMLLNTSLNIKGMPMVDTIADAKEFERKYKCRIF
jgi:carbamoyltransferase